MNNLRTSPQVPAKTFPPPIFFHGAFAPSFIWCRRPWLQKTELQDREPGSAPEHHARNRVRATFNRYRTGTRAPNVGTVFALRKV